MKNIALIILTLVSLVFALLYFKERSVSEDLFLEMEYRYLADRLVLIHQLRSDILSEESLDNVVLLNLNASIHAYQKLSEKSSRREYYEYFRENLNPIAERESLRYHIRLTIENPSGIGLSKQELKEGLRDEYQIFLSEPLSP